MSDRPLNVAYDISWMGFASAEHGRKNGIPRVIEEQARALIATGECSLQLVAPRWAYETSRYVADSDEWRALGLSTTRQQDFEIRWGKVNAAVQESGRRSPVDRVNLAVLRRLAKLGENTLVSRDLLRRMDVYHTPFGKMPPITREFQKLARFHTVHDLIPIKFPHTVAAGHREDFAESLCRIKPDDWVVAVSESAKRDLCEYLKFDPERVFVTYNAADKDVFHVCRDESTLRAARERYKIPAGDFLLSLCTLAPHKNLAHLIRVFGALIAADKIPGVNLVLAGGRSWSSEEIEREFAQQPGLRERVIFTGYVDDADLAALYSGAIAFVFPSLYEGFGIPPLEAMQCGTPVVSSNSSSLPEVVGDAGILVDPTDAQALYNAIADVCSSESLRADLSGRGLARSAQFSWERCARETIAAYRKALR